MIDKMRPGDVLVVVRVAHGAKPPPGFTHRDGAVGTHHGKHTTHAVRLVRKRKKKVKK
jgi:hypothetical protein